MKQDNLKQVAPLFFSEMGICKNQRIIKIISVIIFKRKKYVLYLFIPIYNKYTPIKNTNLFICIGDFFSIFVAMRRDSLTL